MRKNKCSVIFVPGLGDGIAQLEWVARQYWWKDFTPIVVGMEWRDGKHFAPKLARLLTSIDQAAKEGNVLLVGTSAGASAVANAFMKRKNKIQAVVNVCGRLRRGPLSGFRSFQKMTRTSIAFKESVEQFEDQEKLLTKDDRKKILTIHPLFDELVPPETTMINGATNLLIPSVEHGISIGLALTLWSRKIKNFLAKI